MYEENLADINAATNTTDYIRLLRPSRSPRDKGKPTGRRAVGHCVWLCFVKQYSERFASSLLTWLLLQYWRPSDLFMRRAGKLLWRLKIFSLQNAPEFAALSYSRGDRSADKTLRLDTGSTVVKCSVSSDLLCALRRLRQTNDLRWLWVDALCKYADG